MEKKYKNRWLIALSAVGIHISIGSIYAKSVITLPIHTLLGWEKSVINLGFSLAILFLGLSAAFLGRIVEQKGPRISGLTAAVFYSAGIFGTGLSITLNNHFLFLAFYGCVSGIGLGLGYIAPVATLVKWFPDRRGLATGLAIMGFGFASMIFGPVMNWLFGLVGVANTFYILGAVYLTIMISSSLYLELPPPEWASSMKSTSDGKSSSTRMQLNIGNLTANEAIRTHQFYYLWIMLFINITCGIAIISVASPMAQQITGMTAAAAAIMVGLMGALNGIGRIFWASSSDYIGRPNTYIAFFIIQIPLFLMLPSISHPILFSIALLTILTCYGGGFASIPAYIGDVFGTKELARIHGYILTAWAMAGLIGPMLVSWIGESTGSYALTLYIFSGLFVVALIVSVLMKRYINKFLQQRRAA